VARGRFLRFFIGNMASGKTRHLLTEIDTLRKYGNKKIAVFKPRTDVRSGMNLERHARRTAVRNPFRTGSQAGGGPCAARSRREKTTGSCVGGLRFGCGLAE